MWLQRPPTALYWRRGWEAFFKRSYRKQNAITHAEVEKFNGWPHTSAFPFF
jgi:hypothetical protein